VKNDVEEEVEEIKSAFTHLPLIGQLSNAKLYMESIAVWVSTEALMDFVQSACLNIFGVYMTLWRPSNVLF
jgi:hypothetical protein